MSELSKIGPDKRGQEPGGPRRRKKNDSEAFKEMMKVGKVREADPEEKRERKRQSESEEETKEQVANAPPPPPEKKADFTFFSPTPSTPQIQSSPDDTPLPPSQPMYFNEEDLPPLEDIDFSMPTQQDSQTTQQTSSPQTPATSSTPRKKAKEPTLPSPLIEKVKAPHKQTPPHKAAAPASVQKEKSPSLPPLENPVVNKKEHTPPLPIEKQEKKKESQQVEQGEIAPPLLPLPSGGWEHVKDTEKKETVVNAPTGEDTTLLSNLPSPTTPILPQEPIAPTSFVHLPSQIVQIFDKMVGVMTVMNDSGIKETTINLDNPKFAGSIFFGSQIIISEFSTAPKTFNIEMLGNSQSTALFAAHTEELVAAFQSGHYTFKVNRIDTSLLPSIAEEKKRVARRVQRKKTT